MLIYRTKMSPTIWKQVINFSAYVLPTLDGYSMVIILIEVKFKITDSVHCLLACAWPELSKREVHSTSSSSTPIWRMQRTLPRSQSLLIEIVIGSIYGYNISFHVFHIVTTLFLKIFGWIKYFVIVNIAKWLLIIGSAI